MPEAERKPMLAAQKPALDKLLDKNIFIAKPTCADQRSTVITTADVDAAIGDAKAETAVLDRAIAAVRKQLGDDLKKDRNAADNLRVYLVRAKRTDELDALYPKLIAAYPDDYVYPYRWGKSLLERGKPADALPLLEKAAEKAYGENRLVVATFARQGAEGAAPAGTMRRRSSPMRSNRTASGFRKQVEKLKADAEVVTLRCSRDRESTTIDSDRFARFDPVDMRRFAARLVRIRYRSNDHAHDQLFRRAQATQGSARPRRRRRRRHDHHAPRRGRCRR